MSTRQRGNATERQVIGELSDLGYYCALYAHGSTGPIDVLGFSLNDSGLPHVAVQAGGEGKRLRVTFAAMREAKYKPAGSVLLIARRVKKRGRCVMRWYAREDHRGGYPSAIDAITEARNL